jgi:hypothetical protein
VTPIEIEIPKIAKQWREANKTKACLVLLDERGLVSWQFPIITASLGVVKNVPTLLRRHCKRPKGVDTTGGDIPVCFADRKEHLKAFVVGHLNMVKDKMHLMDQKKSLEDISCFGLFIKILWNISPTNCHRRKKTWWKRMANRGG